MPTETNVYSRNLKVISIFYIVYWMLGLHPYENYIALGPVRFEMENPFWLPYIANSLLLYFAWRFFINSRKRVSFSYKKHFTSKMLHRTSDFWCKKLENSAREHFKNQGYNKLMDKQRFFSILDEGSQPISFDEYNLYVPSLQNSNAPTFFEYRYNVSYPQKIKSTPSKGIETFDFKFNVGLKFLINIHMFFLWIISSEDSADYFIPWLLFIFACVSIVLRDSSYNENYKLFFIMCKNT